MAININRPLTDTDLEALKEFKNTSELPFELANKLIEILKGKTIKTPINIVFLCCFLLNSEELLRLIGGVKFIYEARVKEEETQKGN